MDGLVGRGAELDMLGAAVADAAAGTGRLVLIRGDAGIGKTALASAAAERARELGVLVAWGSAWEDGGAPPYWPWVQVLRAVLRVTGPDVVADFRRVQLARLLPELDESAASGASPARTPDGGDPAAARFALFDAVAALLGAASERRPVLVVVDDLHAGGAPAALLTKFVAQATRQLPIAVVAAYRPAPAEPDAELTAVIAALEATGTVLRLGGLDPDAVAQLLGRSADDGVVSTIASRTDGNPLFVREVGRMLTERDGADADTAGWQVPAGITDAVRSRVRGPLRDVLAAAAVLGREFEVEELAELVERPAAELLGVLGQAERADLVRPVGPEALRYRFTHALVAEALAAQLPSPTRAALHAAAGTQLARRAGSAAPAALIARHYLRAVGVIDPEVASAAAATAGEQAMQRLAYEEAAGHYAAALGALQRTSRADPARRCALQLALGDALTRSGNPPRARVVLAEAAALARGLGDAGALARAALLTAERLDFNAVERATIELLGEAAAALDGTDSAALARVLARLAVAGYHSSTEDRRGLADRAVAVARQVGDPGTLASALSARLYATWGSTDPGAAARTAAEIVALADRAHDLERAFEGHTWLVTFNLELGELGEAERAVTALQLLADRLRQPLHRLVALSRRSTLAHARGRLDEAYQLARRAWEAGVAGHEPDADAVHWGQVFAGWLERDVPEDDLGWMETTLRRLVDESPLSTAHEAGLVLLEAGNGRAQQASRRLDGIMARDVTRLPRDMVHIWCLALLARACFELDAREHAPTIYAELAAGLPRCAGGPGVTWLGAVSYHLGLLALCTGDDEAGRRHLADAMELHDRMGARPMLAWTQLHLGRLLASQDPELASALLGAAAGTASELGLTRLRAAVQRTMGAQQAAPGRPSLRREGELWTVSWGHHPVVRVRDSKGVRYLQALVGAPGEEISALHLARTSAGDHAGPTGIGAATEAAAAASGLRIDTGTGADQVIDAAAREAYRARLTELYREHAEAEEWHDTERLAQTRREIDFLERELVAAVGLGGRARPAGNEAERARLAVTRAIRAAIGRIAAADSALGARLDAAVRTGAFCSFAPDTVPRRGAVERTG